ncbi:hypothetical protein [Shimia ponticola]|uniref:hypothetical protein n=1 Tax=Shimia ponticola TaxID=2582893 RepID=UPI0011BF70BE|nr:hypothetical protein [Shimia ponticola]
MALDLHDDARPLMFSPQPGQSPLFFLHIPKTAGSSTNAFLRQVFGVQAVQDHVENLLPDLSARRLPPLTVPCVSGHVPLWAWTLYRGTDVFDRATMLRRPWDRLVSHVNWVARYANGRERLPPGAGGQALARVAELVVETDFEDVRSLRTFMNAVKRERHFSSFDNYQVRMLRSGRMDAMEKRLEQADLSVAERELSGFACVGLCEDQAAFQRAVMARCGMADAPKPVHRNPGQVRVLSRGNTLAREVFAPWLEYDMALYGFVRGLKAAHPLKNAASNEAAFSMSEAIET